MEISKVACASLNSAVQRVDYVIVVKWKLLRRTIVRKRKKRNSTCQSQQLPLCKFFFLLEQVQDRYM